MLEKGAGKIIGKDINIWHDPWVPELPNFRVLARMEIGECPQQHVNELWVDRVWNRNLLATLFSPGEFEKISNIPIPLFDREDSWS